MRFVAVVVLGLATGCRSLLGFDNAVGVGGDAPTGDDAPDDATDAATMPNDMTTDPRCFGTLFPVCLQDLPQQPFTLPTNLVFDTTDNSACVATTNPSAAGYCVFAATSYTLGIGAELSVIGTRPMVIVATTGDLVINGSLDAAAERVNAGVAAAGADPAGGCNAGMDPTLAGGAPGGSFGGQGGAGAKSNQNGNGGTAGATVVPTDLRGGCRGTGGDMALGGRGGGSVMLISRGTVRIAGSVNASGAGGQGGPVGEHGGGGGGSGGMIVIDAPMIDTPGQVWANGGGGGGGSNGSQAGTDGTQPVNASQTAQGGSGGGAAGGQGGQGSHGLGGQSGQNGGGSAGGGGGGGGAGVIRYTVAATGGNNVSPTPQVGP